jgi:cob(I)alamin adenosyltransferase
MKPNIGSGDKGQTDFHGERVDKCCCNIDSIGTIDELNSFLGLVRSINKDNEIDSIIEKVQNDLFTIGADIATSNNHISKENVKFLESSMQELEKELAPLNKFILPAGNQVSSLLHVARAVCRRAEREVVALSKQEKINEQIIPYLNRLSDLFFTLARVVNKRAELEEKEWSKD